MVVQHEGLVPGGQMRFVIGEGIEQRIGANAHLGGKLELDAAATAEAHAALAVA